MKIDKEILENSFFQLIVIYTILVGIIGFGFISKYTLHFEIFALILGITGAIILHKNKEKINLKNTTKNLIVLLFLGAIFIFRAIPYLKNKIPLGYDAGIYKFALESQLKNLDNWIIFNQEPLFLYLMKPLTFILSTNFLLTWGFIGINVLLGFAIYYCTKEYFGKKAGLISLAVYSVSTVQFIAFTYMYYRNIIGLVLMLFGITFLKKSNQKNYRFLFIIFLGFLGAIHRPTYYVFGVSYFIYTFIAPFKEKKYSLKILKFNLINGISILLVSLLFYIGKFWPSLTIAGAVAESFVNPGQSPGTFISFFQYQFLTLSYLPFAIIGLGHLFKNKEKNLILIWAIFNLAIVYFQLFFFNRFLIHLDIVLIILSGLGFSILISKKKILGIFAICILLVSAGFITYSEAKNSRPLISQKEFDFINQIDKYTEEGSYIMALSKEYSPWILAYSQREVIAPGLFDLNQWNESQWEEFWKTNSEEKTKELMSLYETEKTKIYLYSGTVTFNNPCFELFLEENNIKLYEYEC